MTALLAYESVNISYNGKTVVRDVTFSLSPGEILGIVGESGSGKSTLIKAALGLLGSKGQVTGGSIFYQQTDLLALTERERRKINGAEIGMVFQDAEASLSPIRKIGDQLHESMNAHAPYTKEAVEAKALKLFKKIGLDGKRILTSYPFELSGGMNQRVGIAMAMLTQPRVLLCDEPTSALDVSVQKQVLDELAFTREMFDTSIVLVTHNIKAVSALSDSLLVLKDGRVQEYGQTDCVLTSPASSYTKKLLDAVPVLRRS